MSKIQIKSESIKQLAQECGFDVCGIAKAELDSKVSERFRAWIRDGNHAGMKYLENFDRRAEDYFARLLKIKSVIVLGVNYYSSEKTETGANVLKGRVARYAWGRDYHEGISKMQQTLIGKIKSLIPESFWDGAVDTKPIFERSFAKEAGLGFIGKQTQLLSLQFGPWLFLSELLTDLELEPDLPHSGSCGTCRICIDECPTEAIEEIGRIDARKCIAYLTIENKGSIPEPLRPKIGNWVFGCDECLNVCPYVAKQKTTSHEQLISKNGFGPNLKLEELFQIKDQREYEEKFSGTAILRANRKQLLRNACVTLGNSRDERALSILEEALKDSSEMVREHAQWAIHQIEQA